MIKKLSVLIGVVILGISCIFCNSMSVLASDDSLWDSGDSLWFYKPKMGFSKEGFAIITNGKNIFMKFALGIFPKENQVIDFPCTGFPATEADWILPDDTLPYSVFTFWGKADYDILYNDLYLSAEADSARGLTFYPDNKVSMTGCSGEHELIVASDKRNISYTLSGDNNGDFSLFINEKGEAVVEGDVSGNKLLCEHGISVEHTYEMILEEEGIYSISDFHLYSQINGI